MNLKDDFEDKKKELEAYFDFLKFLDSPRSNTQIQELESNKVFSMNNELYKVMKANCYLMLYNLIEGTIVEGLNTIFIEISSKKPFRNELIELYQKICIDYNIKVIDRLKDQEKLNPFEPYAQDDAIRNIDVFEIKGFKKKSIDKNSKTESLIGYDAYLEVIGSKDISGNLDVAKIRILLPKYGIITKDKGLIVYIDENEETIRLDTEHIRSVKQYRNELAHGSLQYSKVGERVSYSEINEIKRHVFTYLEEIVDKIELFLTKEEFKKNN